MRLRGFWMRIKVENFEPKRLKEVNKSIDRLEKKQTQKPKKRGLLSSLLRLFKL